METGQEKLVKDLKGLLKEAKEGQFTDFQNTKYDFPKLTLTEKLSEIIENCKRGKYDD